MIVRLLAFCTTIALLAATPASALEDGKQLLSGAVFQGSNSTEPYYTIPGSSIRIAGDEKLAQLRMAGGTLSRLRVRIRTTTVPDSGSVEIMVRINGADTTLTCSLPGTGSCSTTSRNLVEINDNDRLSIEFTSTLGVLYTITYSFIFD